MRPLLARMLLGGVVLGLSFGIRFYAERLAPVPLATQGSVLRQVEVNQASQSDLEALPGIGPVLAGAIVEDRHLHGPYRDLEALTRVPGIGRARLKQIAPFLRFASPPPTPEPPDLNGG